MSKAEEMKLERKKRKDAVDKMTAVVFTEIQKRLRKCQNKVSITIQTGPNGRHRYFTVRQYKEKVAINIYNDGNVDAVLEEMVYGEVSIPLIRYKEMNDIDVAITQMKEYVSVFFKAFFEGGMHEFLAFISGCDIESEWKAAYDSYKEYLAECRRHR